MNSRVFSLILCRPLMRTKVTVPKMTQKKSAGLKILLVILLALYKTPANLINFLLTKLKPTNNYGGKSHKNFRRSTKFPNPFPWVSSLDSFEAARQAHNHLRRHHHPESAARDLPRVDLRSRLWVLPHRASTTPSLSPTTLGPPHLHPARQAQLKKFRHATQ